MMSIYKTVTDAIIDVDYFVKVDITSLTSNGPLPPPVQVLVRIEIAQCHVNVPYQGWAYL